MQQDVNANVTALVDATPGSSTYGTVVERFNYYTPYGQVSVMDGNWNPLTGSSSAPAGSPQYDTTYAWRYMFQCGRYDTVTGLYHFGARDYNPVERRVDDARPNWVWGR